MKAILEFNIPDDAHDFRHCSVGVESSIAISDIKASIRSKLKYGHDFKSPEQALECMRQIVNEHTENLPELE